MFKTLSKLAASVKTAHHANFLFSLSDAELAARGFDREGLSRSIIVGMARS